MIISVSDFCAGCVGGGYYTTAIALFFHYLDHSNMINQGMVGVVVGHPMDTLKVIQQTMNVSFTKATILTYKYSGIPGFFRGMVFPLFTIGPSNAVFFCSYGSCMKQLQNNTTSERVLYTGHWIGQSFIAGCVAGFVQAVGTGPTELVKTILQAQVRYDKHIPTDQYICKDIMSCLKFIIKKDGVIGLYKGFLPLFIRIIFIGPTNIYIGLTILFTFPKESSAFYRMPRDVPTSGIYMVTYEYYTHDMPIIEGSLYLHNMMGGGLAGVANWAFITPFDAVKSRIQQDYSTNQDRLYKSMTHCFIKTYQDEGLGIFFKGWLAITSRAFLVHSVTFLVYSSIMDWWK